MDKQKASKVISEKLAQAEALIRECQSIADSAGVGFSWDLEYGMGGYYSPAEWQSSGCEWDTSDSQESGRWEASSQSC